MHRNILILVAGALGALAVASCTPEYTYAPATTSNAVVSGKPAADYSMAPQSSLPRATAGDVRVATFGIVPVHAPGGEVQALHVRMIFANDGVAPWTFDSRDQRIVLSNGEESRPSFAAAGLGTPPPVLQIATGGRRVVDLFFPLPHPVDDATRLPEFKLVWSVQSGSRKIEHQTAFDRVTVPPQGDGWDIYGM